MAFALALFCWLWEGFSRLGILISCEALMPKIIAINFLNFVLLSFVVIHPSSDWVVMINWLCIQLEAWFGNLEIYCALGTVYSKSIPFCYSKINLNLAKKILWWCWVNDLAMNWFLRYEVTNPLQDHWLSTLLSRFYFWDSPLPTKANAQSNCRSGGVGESICPSGGVGESILKNFLPTDILIPKICSTSNQIML